MTRWRLMRLAYGFVAIVAFLFINQVQAQLPTWVQQARLGGMSLQSNSSETEVTQRVVQAKNQNVSVVELDTSLSRYLDEAAFNTELNFINSVAQKIHTEGMKVVIYYPAMEVVTPNGETSPQSMFKDNPDWIQVGIDGKPNVFYGSQEDWVEPGMESAWLSPNSPYRDYFINRVQRLASETQLDGIWIDVPIYLDTGSPWADVGPHGAQAFTQWSAAKGFNHGNGYAPPAQADFNNAIFRVWLRWRHENLAAFIEEVRVKALAVNPNFVVAVETYPMDYMDTVWTGLDPAFMNSQGNFLRVWEVDSVSNVMGMQWSSIEDFSNKIAMNKWARGIDRELPSWTFVYGNQPLDTGLVLAAAVATRQSPFETKTPIMTQTVDGALRQRWFDFVKTHQTALLETDRLARVGVWFSSATREYQDMPAGAQYGMYLQSTPPTIDPDWWAVVPDSSVRLAPHVGGWRGAAHALHQLAIPYKVISDPGTPAQELSEVSMVWLPSVGSISEASAAIIRQFVQQGGTVFATGRLPGVLDEWGTPRSQSILDDVFGFQTKLQSGARMQRVGEGVAIYRPDIKGLDLFAGEGGNSGLAQRTLGEVEQLLRIHTHEDIIVDLPTGMFIEISKPTANQQHLYIVNYTGLQQPIVASPVNLQIQFRAPEGFRVVKADIATPDIGVGAQQGDAAVLNIGEDVYLFDVNVEQFALVTLQLEALPVIPATPYPGLTFSTPQRQEAVASGLNFILSAMRDNNAPIPYRYGIRTNLLDNNSPTEVYTGGHHVTAEHMGLLLRVTALLKDETAYQQAYEFVNEVLYSRGYHVVGWSMHKNIRQRFLQADELNNQPVWFAANAPLDDLRVVRGLLEGLPKIDLPEATLLGRSILTGLYWTSVTDRKRGIAAQFPAYAGGLLGISWDWSDQDDNGLTPPAVATGLGRIGTFPIPVDYQDLETISMAAEYDPRWRTVLAAAVDLMLDAEIAGSPGLFYNGLGENNQFTGDFEFVGERQGQHLKMIQELWTALHLKRVANVPGHILDGQRSGSAANAAQSSYNFFKNLYLSINRLPEYLTTTGQDVPNCNNNVITGNCLIHGTENLFNGEARIYAQLARLALLFDDNAFAAQVIDEKILTDRISNANDARYGLIGVSTAGTNDAEAWNTLESLLTLALEAAADQGQPGGENKPPVATNDQLLTGKNTPLQISAIDVLGNDSDPDGDILAIQSIDTTSQQAGTIVQSGGAYVYTPATDFLGDDTFAYVVSDGNGGTASATITVTVDNAVTPPPPSGVVVDGSLAEWPASSSMGTDPNDISGAANKLDLLEMLMNHDTSTLYIAYRNDGPVVLDWAYTLYIDTDQNASTGFGFWQIGADYVIQDKSVLKYTGTGTDWAWQYIGDITVAVNGNIAEFSLPRAWLGNPAQFNFIFYGDNAAYGGTAEEYFPNTVTAEMPPLFLSYHFGGGGGNTNQTPVAQSQSVTTSQNQAISVLLQASDGDGDALTYRIVTPPSNGLLSGTAPNLTYTPITDFVGNDEFSFQVNDSKVDSAIATISVTVTGTAPPPPAGIVIDGSLAEWPASSSMGTDPNEISGAANQLDLLELLLSNDGSKLYVAYRNDGPVVLDWAYTLYIDTDQNATTGFAFWDIGADYVIEDKAVLKYTGTGTDWSWQYIGDITVAVSGNIAEYSLPRAWIGNPAQFNLVFYGDNAAYGGTAQEYFPDTANGSGTGPLFLTYPLQ